MADGDIILWQAPAPQNPSEWATTLFYAWERRGRGWQVWPYPVELEPPFRPLSVEVEGSAPGYDDGRKHTWLSALTERITRRLTGSKLPALMGDASGELVIREPSPELFHDTSSLVTLRAVLPPSTAISREVSERFLLSLRYCTAPVGLEVVGRHDAISVQLACRRQDLSTVREQLRAYVPDAVLTEEPDLLLAGWESASGDGLVVDLGLAHEFMRPLRSAARLDPDPLIAVTGALGDLGDKELGILQVLFQPCRATWAQEIIRAVTGEDGGAFFADAPDMIPLARAKISQPLFAAVIRLAAKSPDQDRAWTIARALGGALVQFSDPKSNELIPLSSEGYDEEEHEADLLSRLSHRSGMILNVEELVSFVHLPSSSVRSPKLVRETAKTKAAPATLSGYRLVLGENIHAGKTVPVTLSSEIRSRHTYVIGASGTGKSTLLLSMIVQDLRNGEGLAVLDPHGDLIDQVLGYVPEERIKDVILLDPSDEEYPVGFNILSAHSSLEQTLLASDLVAVFRRLSTSWGDQMTSVLGNAVLAFLESDTGGTLADLRRFLVEADFRRAFLASVRDPEVVYYWTKEFPLLTGKPQAPLLTRLDTFLRPKHIRRMVAQKENRLDFSAIMNEGKLVLAKLSQGAIGEENAHLLGTLLVSSFHRTALGRQGLAASSRRPFYLYIDEFHHFATPSMASVLSGARKYGLSLILAHQELRQLGESEVASAVLSNPATRICFRVGDSDARRLAEGFSFFDAKDLQNLGVGEAIARVERGDQDFTLRTVPLPSVPPEVAASRRDRVIVHSRATYASRREDMDAQLSTERPEPLTREVAVPPSPQVPQPPTRPRPERSQSQLTARPLQSVPAPAPSLGRGGPQHQYLQNIIKRWAESREYRVTVELPILDGMGSVDVALEKDDLRIACEITVTTSPEHEVGNVQKCLAAGFAYVAVVSPERKTLTKLEELLAPAVGEVDRSRVHLCVPEELFAFLETLGAHAQSAQATVRGYKVKVQYKPGTEGTEKEKKKAVGQVILGALKRLRERR